MIHLKYIEDHKFDLNSYQEGLSLDDTIEACQLAMLDQAAIDALKEEEDMDHHYTVGWNMALDTLIKKFKDMDYTDWTLTDISDLKKNNV